jgi:hypothetical protein
LRHAVARYRDARRALRTPASRQSRAGLDWMNFFVADVQTGFGAFVAFYLAHHDWSVRDVGFMLTLGAISLGLVGRRAMSLRTGRNYRFAAGGHALTAAIMGLVGTYLSSA